MLPYVVQAGDTPLRVAKRFNLNLCSLLAANPQLPPEGRLQPGIVLSIPEKRGRMYSVQAGDSWLKIADRFSCSLQALRTLNPRLDPQRLMLGQLVLLPDSLSLRIVETRAEYGFRELEEDLLAMERQYPFLSKREIGASVMGKPIYAVKLGEGAKKVHVNAAMHANEWITTPLLMTFIEDVAAAYTHGGKVGGSEIRKLLQEVSLWCVPLVNPDGVELVQEGLGPQHERYYELLDWNQGSERFANWKANIRGIDLNDQFPAFWEEEVKRREAGGPGPRDFPGERPLSEPEAIAIARLTNEERFDLAVALHTQGKEIYWNYRGYEPVQAEGIAHRMGRRSGFKPVKLKGSDAGYKDWFIYEFRKPGFTIELGYGVNPLPLQDAAAMYDDLKLILLEAMKAAADQQPAAIGES